MVIHSNTNKTKPKLVIAKSTAEVTLNEKSGPTASTSKDLQVPPAQVL